MAGSPTLLRFKDAFRRHPTAIAGGVILLVMIGIAILAPWLGTVDPQAVAPLNRLKQPSAEYWFGSDMLGRDVYSRVVYGARVSLAAGLAVAVLSRIRGLAIRPAVDDPRSRDRSGDGLPALGRRDRHAHHGRPHVDPVGAARDRAGGAHQG